MARIVVAYKQISIIIIKVTDLETLKGEQGDRETWVVLQQQ